MITAPPVATTAAPPAAAQAAFGSGGGVGGQMGVPSQQLYNEVAPDLAMHAFKSGKETPRIPIAELMLFPSGPFQSYIERLRERKVSLCALAVGGDLVSCHSVFYHQS